MAKHVQCGARMQSAGDWWVPCFYTSIDEEYWRIRKGAGFVDYSFHSAIEVSGKDAFTFLQKTIVNDLGRIEPGRALYTNILEPNAKFVDETVIFWLDQDRFIINGGPVPRKDHLIALLNEWSADLELRIVDLNTCFLAVQGPKSREILAAAIDIESMPFMSVRRDNLDGLPILLARTGYSGELGYEIHVAPEYAERLWDALVELGRDGGLGPYGLGATALLSIEKGLLGPNDFYPGSTPLELGLKWTVAVAKGDFNGRSELSRRQDAGLLTRLVGFEVDDYFVQAAPGMRLFRGARPVGGVTHKNLYGPSIEKNLGRCWVESAFANVGEQLEIEYLGDRKAVTLSSFRHYDPDNKRMRS